MLQSDHGADVTFGVRLGAAHHFVGDDEVHERKLAGAIEHEVRGLGDGIGDADRDDAGGLGFVVELDFFEIGGAVFFDGLYREGLLEVPDGFPVRLPDAPLLDEDVEFALGGQTVEDGFMFGARDDGAGAGDLVEGVVEGEVVPFAGVDEDAIEIVEDGFDHAAMLRQVRERLGGGFFVGPKWPWSCQRLSLHSFVQP